MEFNKKLQELRKAKGLTQEDLAKSLFVSRTAISKWELGKGYPNIESLKAIANFFDTTIDELLSKNELLTLAEENTKHKERRICDLVFGLLDISILAILFLPFFGQELNGMIIGVSLLSLTDIAAYLNVSYYIVIFVILSFGIFSLTMQNCEHKFWLQIKSKISLILGALAIILFIISKQPYAAIYLFIITAIKVIMLIKRK